MPVHGVSAQTCLHVPEGPGGRVVGGVEDEVDRGLQTQR